MFEHQQDKSLEKYFEVCVVFTSKRHTLCNNLAGIFALKWQLRYQYILIIEFLYCEMFFLCLFYPSVVFYCLHNILYRFHVFSIDTSTVHVQFVFSIICKINLKALSACYRLLFISRLVTK